MFTNYCQVISPLKLFVEEESGSYLSPTERHLQVLWMEQKFFSSLKTSEGQAIEVISPGIWNTEAGPDFLKAHLRIGHHTYRGAVEIHLHESGWYQHGHHCDPLYNQVILHLVYWPSEHPKMINKENGQQAFSCYFNNSLTHPIHQIMAQLDLDLYPSKEFIGKGHCSKHLFQSLEEEKTREFLRSAAYWRLEKKLNFIEYYSSDQSLQFAGGIAMALGYKHNAIAFLELFHYLLPQRDLPAQELLAIALGCCGFLENNPKKEWEKSAYYQELRLLWWGRQSEVNHQTKLKLNRIRPLHHPLRRLSYLIHFLQDPRMESLWLKVQQIWAKPSANEKNPFRCLKDQFLEVIPSYQDAYWDYHYTFELEAQNDCLPGLGEDIKTQILLNTVLPLLYRQVRRDGDAQQWNRFQDFYASLKIAETSKSRYLHGRFFGESQKENFFLNAQMAQGAYQLHHDFCVHFEASCEGCPFVDRFKSFKSFWSFMSFFFCSI